MKNLYILIALFFSVPIYAEDSKTQMAIDWIMKSCISGGSKVSISGQGEANLKFKSILSSGISGEVALDYDELQGLGDELNKVSLEHADKVRNCIEPYRMQIFNAIMGLSNSSQDVQKNEHANDSINYNLDNFSTWYTWGEETHRISEDKNFYHSAPSSYLVEATTNSTEGDRGGVSKSNLPANEFRGSKLKVSGYLKGENLSDAFIWLWVSESNQKKEVDLYFKKDKAQKINKNWTYFEIITNIPNTAKTISFGLNVGSKGKVWLDSVKLEAVSNSEKEIYDAILFMEN